MKLGETPDTEHECGKCGHSWLAHEVGEDVDGQGCFHSYPKRCGCEKRRHD